MDDRGLASCSVIADDAGSGTTLPRGILRWGATSTKPSPPDRLTRTMYRPTHETRAEKPTGIHHPEQSGLHQSVTQPVTERLA